MTLPLCGKNKSMSQKRLLIGPVWTLFWIIIIRCHTMYRTCIIAYITVSTVTVSESICDIGSNMPHLALLSVLAMRHKSTVKSHELILSYWQKVRANYFFYPRDATLVRELAMVPCPSVSLCHKSVFYQNCQTDRASFWYGGFYRPVLRRVIRKLR